MTTIAARNVTGGALEIDNLKVVNRVLPAFSDTVLTPVNRITDIQEDPQLLQLINDDEVLLVLDGLVQTKAQSLNLMTPVVSGTNPTFNTTTDTGGGAGNAGYLVALDGAGNLDGRDVGTDGATLDAHVASTSNPHSTSFSNLTDTDLTGFAQGSVVYFDGTNWVQLAPGTSGNFLQTAGAGADPLWASVTTADELVGVSANDTTPGYLSDKLTTATTGVAWTEINDGGDEDYQLDIDTASLTGQGLIELATQTEVDAGTDALRAVTPSTLASAATVIKPGDAAGGDLSGTYPNPTVTDLTITGEQQGSVLYFDGSNWVRLAPGTNGDFLQTQGAGANPQWASVTTADELVGVSGNDTTPGYLSDKLITATSGVAWTEINDGGDEDYRLDINSASEGGQGLISIATQLVVNTGTNNTAAVTPQKLANATTVIKPGDTAGGDLSGTYPNPTVSDLTITGEQQGSVLYYDGTNWVNLAPGTSGQYLQTAGVGADPLWAAVSHTNLSNLAWNSSGHTGTAGRLAGFDGGGAASFYQIGADVQAWDTDLDAYAALATTGIVVRTGAGAATTRSLTQPSTGITITNADGVGGNPTFALANDLLALENLASTGFATRTSANTWAQRAIQGSGNRITVTNGLGVGGNPIIDVGVNIIQTTTALGGDLDGFLPNPTVTDLTITGETQGSVLYFDGTNWAQLAPGTNGQFLQTQGAGANPQWAAAATTDELVGVSGNDTTPGYLSDKLITATSGVAWTEINDGGDEDYRLDIDTASLTGQGLIELATQTEVDTGTDALRAVTPSTLASSATVIKPGDTASGDLSGTYPNPTVTDFTIAGQQQGSVLYYDGANWAQLAPATGQFLQSQGTGADPLWTSDVVQVTTAQTITGQKTFDDVTTFSDEILSTGGLLDFGSGGVVSGLALPTTGTQAANKNYVDSRSIDDLTDVDTTTTSPTAGDSLEWDGSNWVPASAQGYIVFPVWAEENSSLINNGFEWSFGNGAEGNIGIPLALDCEMFAVSVNAESPGTAVSIDVYQNGAQTYTASFTGNDQVDMLVSPESFAAGDRVGFRTNTVSGSWTDVRVCAWFRVRASPASTSILNDLLDVSLTGAAQGDLLYNNGTSWVNLSAGTNGQFLQTQGTGANPQWASVTAADERVGVSANDTTPGYLSDKLTTATSGVAWTEINDGGDEDYRLDIDTASLTGQGLIELATQTEVDTGTDALRAVTPSTLASAATVIKPGDAAGGDLSGTYPNPSVNLALDDLTDVDLTTTAPTLQDFLRWDGSNWVPLKNNHTTTDPTASDDNTAGYSVGSYWINTSSDDSFVCLDASTGAAVWGEVAFRNQANIFTESQEIEKATGQAVLELNSLSSDSLLVFRNTGASEPLWAAGSHRSSGEFRITRTNGLTASLEWALSDTELDVYSKRIRNVTDPLLAQDVATKNYVDSLSIDDLTDVDLAGEAQGDLLYFDGTDWVNLSAGTSGEFLQTQGTGADPQWSNDVCTLSTNQTITGNKTFSGTTTYTGVTNYNALADFAGNVNLQSTLTVDTGSINMDGFPLINVATPTSAGDAVNKSYVDNLTLDDISDVSVSGQATGDVLYFNGTNWVRLAAGTTGQLLQTNGAAAPSWVDRANIAQYRQSNNLTINTSATTVALNATDFEDSAYSRSGSNITISTAGIYRISYSVYFDTLSGSRRTIDAWVENNTVEIVPSRSSAYARNSVDDTESATATFLVSLSASDVVRLRCQSTGTNGSCGGVGNRMWINLELVRAT